MKKRTTTHLAFLATLTCASLLQAETTPLVSPSAEDKALAERATAAAKAAQETPAREQANFLMSGWPNKQLIMLGGTNQIAPSSLDFARKIVTEMMEVIEKGPTWPRPSKLTVPYSSTAPVIDGLLDDSAWAKAVTLTTSYAYNKIEPLTKPVTTWKILWDEKYLYFAFDCADEDIIAPVLPRDGMPFKFDSVEIFLLPEFRQSLYWELVIGATGSIYDGLNAKKFKDWGSETRSSENIEGLKIATHVEGTANQPGDKDKRYSVEVAIPFKELPTYTRGNAAQKGDMLNFLIARMSLDGDAFTAIAPFPVLSWGHNIWNYAPLELGQ
jgi:hypothetical protein